MASGEALLIPPPYLIVSSSPFFCLERDRMSLGLENDLSLKTII